jgi:hypothetical protein
MVDVTLRQNACRGLVNRESAMYNERECARFWSGRLYTHMRRRVVPFELVLYLRIADRYSDRGADWHGKISRRQMSCSPANQTHPQG